jgi:hypothetical protein
MLVKARLRIAAGSIAIVSVLFSALPARADGIENVYEQSVLPGANAAIKQTMEEAQRKRDAEQRKAAPQVAQAPPVAQQPIGPTIGLPTGFGYSADITSAYPDGDIGTFGQKWLMGGFDAALSYGFNSTTRVVASVYELQHWPYGFNSGQVPVYLAGFRNPVGCADLSGGNVCGPGAGQNINVATKDTFGVFMLQKLFLIKGMPGGHVLPIVISPTYVARGGQIGQSGAANNDVVPFSGPPPDGPVLSDVPTRTAQFKAVAVTLPFLKTPKMFGTFTLVPQWLVHTAGLNVGNSMQLGQVLYVEYTPSENTKLWFEPQSARDYLPTDPYPEHLAAYFLGVSQRITKYAFVGIVLNSGNSTNLGDFGVRSITCLSVAVCAPHIGGFKATQLQFQLGIGSPGYFPL